MSEPIYKLFTAKFTEAWYHLSADQQTSLMAKVNDALERVGGKRIVLCDSSWSSERWIGFGVEQFPSLEAVQNHARLLNELNWLRYLESKTLLGTEWEPPTSSST
jgi:hypothetical protein